MGRKKQFVSKNSAQHYKLVFKSQNPFLNQANDEEPNDTEQNTFNPNDYLENSDKVFLPTNKYKKRGQRSNIQTPSTISKRESFDEELDEMFGDEDPSNQSKNDLSDNENPSADPRLKKRRRKHSYRLNDFEYGEYGFPDDGYDYSQHFAEMGNGTFISAVLAETESKSKSKSNKQHNAPISFKDSAHSTSKNQKTIPQSKPQTESAEISEKETEDEDEEVKKLKKIDLEIYEALFPEKKSTKKENNLSTNIESQKEPEPSVEGDLQDDFILIADQVGEEEEEGEDEQDESFDEIEREEIVKRVRELHINEKQVKSSSILDRQFELLQREYDDEEIGDLEGDDRAKGNHQLDSELLQQIIKDYPKGSSQIPVKRYNDQNYEDDDENEFGSGDEDEDLPELEAFGEEDQPKQIPKFDEETEEEKILQKQKIFEILSRQDRDEDDGDDEFEEYEEPVGEQWDCESILTTYSNLSNHPSVIVEEPLKKTANQNSTHTIIELSKKTGIPLNTLPQQKPPKPKHKKGNLGEKRSKEETPEEKAARKKQIKDQKQVSRQRKKNLKIAFKEEKKQVVLPPTQRILPMNVL